jgi:WD40 repeat protein
MTMLNSQRFLIIPIVLGLLGTGAFGQDQVSPRDRGGDTNKTDVHGDPLPEGAKARMGTLRWRHPADIHFVGFISQDKQVLTGCADGYYRVWDCESGKEIRRFGKPNGGQFLGRRGIGIVTYGININIALAPDGSALVESGMDGRVRIWDVSSGKEIGRLGTDPKKEKDDKTAPVFLSDLAISPDSKMIATRGLDQVIRLWDISTGKEIREMGKPPKQQAGVGGAKPAFFGNTASHSLAFLGDGKSIVSVGREFEDQRPVDVLRVFEVASGKEQRQIKSGQQNFLPGGALTVLPKTATIAWANGNDGTVTLYDADSGKEVRKLGKQQQNVYPLRTILISPDGKVMATQITNGRATHLWDVDNGKELWTLGEGVLVGLAGRGNCMTCAFSSDGKTLAQATIGDSIRLWQMDTGKEKIQGSSGHHGEINRLAVSADGKTLTTFASDRTIHQWDMASGKEIRQQKLARGWVSALSSKMAAWDVGTEITLWDVDHGKETHTIDMLGPPQPMSGGVILSPQDKWLVVRGLDRILHLYDTGTGKEISQLIEQEEPSANRGFDKQLTATPMGFSADGTVFAAVGVNTGYSLRLWNLAQGKQPRLFDTPRKTIVDLVVSPDGQNVVSANADNTLSVWEAVTGKECLRIKMNRPGTTCMTISPDGRTLAVGMDRTVYLWDLRTGKEIGHFKGHEGSVVSVVFAPDSRTLITGSSDTSALVWDASRFIKETPTIALKAEQIEELWRDLAGDSVKAYQAARTLSAAPEQAVALVKEKIKPVADLHGQRIAKLIADLESDKIQIRQTAFKELEKLGELAEPALQKANQKPKSLEHKHRVESLLSLLAKMPNDQVPSAEVLRTLRAVQVLGWIGTPKARTELERLAKGAPGEKLTRSAETTLKRFLPR